MLQPRPSSYKIPLLLLLVALTTLAALVLVFRPAAKNQKNTLAVTVFSQPRPVQAFELGSSEDHKNVLFSQANFDHHWTFLFFGFTHCSEVCPASLTELKEVYQHLHNTYPNLQIVFVSIDPTHEQKADPQHYAASFNENFIGLQGTVLQLKMITQQFGVFAEPNANTINHTSSIFLINPKGEWVALFPYGMRSKQIQANLKTIIEDAHV